MKTVEISSIYSHQTSDGYRDHTNLRRDIVTWESMLKNNDRQTLSTYAFYGDLYYQTPGALTLSQYNADPKQSRPAVGSTPSADQAQAAIYQKTFMAAIVKYLPHHRQISEYDEFLWRLYQLS